VTPDLQEPTYGPHPRRNARGRILRPYLRSAALSILGLGLLAGIAAALERYFTEHITRHGSEQTLVFQLDAPYGSVDLRPGSDPNDVAAIETLAEDSDAHNAQWSYGIRNGSVGVLRIGIGTDEGMKSTPPIAMWHTNSDFSLASSTAPESDMGIPMRPSRFFFFSMPRAMQFSNAGPSYMLADRSSMSDDPRPMRGSNPLESSFGLAPPRSAKFHIISTDAGNKVEVASSPGTRIYLTKNLPIVFSSDLGFGQSKLDLSGLSITSASIETGASQAFIYSREPNPQVLHFCSVRAGIGPCTFLGISNLNADHFTFHGAVGSYHLGFEGRLTHNLDAIVEIGLGMCSLSIPPTSCRVQVFYDDGLLSSFSFSGLAKERDGYATSPGFDHSTAPILTLHLSSGAGKISVSYH